MLLFNSKLSRKMPHKESVLVGDRRKAGNSVVTKRNEAGNNGLDPSDGWGTERSKCTPVYLGQASGAVNGLELHGDASVLMTVPPRGYSLRLKDPNCTQPPGSSLRC